MRVRFGPFSVDTDTRQLARLGRPLHLSPKAFTLLVALISERPRVLAKHALQQAIWPDTFVIEANLSNLVGELRAVLGDARRRPCYIRTEHGFGYAFCATVEADESVPAEQPPTLLWLEWSGRRYPLSAGEQIIGRDPDADVQLDHATVSRRHARLLVSAAGAAIEDAGSKNGTFRGSERVTTSAVPLADGDLLHIGSLVVTFHGAPAVLSTVTDAGNRSR